MIDFLIDLWASDKQLVIVALVLVVLEVLVRLIPTHKDYSLIDNVLILVGKLAEVIPNRAPSALFPDEIGTKTHKVAANTEGKTSLGKKILNTGVDILSMLLMKKIK